MALVKCCVRHPKARRHLFFLQIYLTSLSKGPHKGLLDKEIVDIDVRDAVAIICNMEGHETDEMLLTLSRAFLSQELCRGDMYYMWDLVFVWSKLFRRVNPTKQAFLKESKELMLSATNVKSIFLFMRVVLTEIGEEGIQFCVEMCASALRSSLPCDPQTKSHIYKTIASLLPRDLEVCRTCTLLVFFVERSVEAYRTVIHLYTQPDQEYNAETSSVGNHVRFEILQVLKKGLYFDPEFFNLLNLRTNCLKLMSEKVMNCALEEIKEEAWEPNHCTKEVTCCSGTYQADFQCHATLKKRHLKKGRNKKSANVDTQLSDIKGLRPKERKVARIPKAVPELSRRSFRQTDSTQGNRRRLFCPGDRRITRLSEKNHPKRKIRKPRWLLEDSGAFEENRTPQNINKVSKRRSAHKRRRVSGKPGSPVSGSVKNKAKLKTAVASRLVTNGQRPSKRRRRFSIIDSPEILELSQPDNELAGVFSEERLNIQSNHKKHLHKRTAALLTSSLPVKGLHRNAVVLRPKDASAFVQQLHCYTRRAKGNGVVNMQASTVTAVTRSSVIKAPSSVFGEIPEVEMKVTFAAQELVEVERNSQDLPELESLGAAAALTTLPCAGQMLKQNPTLLPRKPDNVMGPITKDHANSGKRSTFGDETVLSDMLPSVQQSPIVSENFIVLEVSKITSVTGLHKEPSCLLKESTCHEENIALPLTVAVSDGVTTDKNVGTQVCKKHIIGDDRVLSASGLTTQVIEPGGSSHDVKENQRHEVETPDCEIELNENEVNVETPDCSNPVVTPCDLEETLEYSCTLCNKVFKGKRVAAHAMFHYRGDRCMFCGMLFKDDLLAMIHMSEHIEKLKKSKKGAVREAIEKISPRNHDHAEAFAKPMHNKSRHKLSVMDSPVSFPLDCRKLRSNNNKKTVCPLISKSNKEPFHVTNSESKVRQTKDVRVGEQTGTLLEARRDKNILLPGKAPSEPQGVLSTSPSQQENKPLCSLPNQGGVEPQACSSSKTGSAKKEPFVIQSPSAGPNRVNCAVEGCDWYTDLSRKRVTLLYHALEEHQGEQKALELAYRIGNSKCSICTRILWSFQHYLDHVGRHRLSPRHPCLHRGCGARFKTGIEMRRHSRRHSPLQAECCASGCSEIFACLWALNLHEREHYSSKPFSQTADDKSSVGNELKDFNEQGNKKSPVSLPRNEVKTLKDMYKLRQKAIVEPLSIMKDPKDAPSKPGTIESGSHGLKDKKLNDLKISMDASPLCSSTRTLESKKSLRRKHVRRKCWSVHSVENVPTVSSKNRNGNVKKTIRKLRGISDLHASKRRGGPCHTIKLNKKRIELDQSKAPKVHKLKVTNKLKGLNDQPVKSACPNTTVEMKRMKTLGCKGRQGTEERFATDSAQKPRASVSTIYNEKASPNSLTAEEHGKLQLTELYLRKKPLESNEDTHVASFKTTSMKTKCIVKEESIKSTVKNLIMSGDYKFLYASKPTTIEDCASNVSNRLKSNVNLVGSCGDSVKVNGQSHGIIKEAQRYVQKVESHAEEKVLRQPESLPKCNQKEEKVESPFGRKPYTRLPPTAYLDEQYTTMPKRRKMPFPYCSSTHVDLVNASATLPRQRCAKCFSTFDRMEALQTHLLLKNCTSLFGFDSDEESK